MKKLTGGYTNEAFLLENTKPLVVAKIVSDFNNNILNEVLCLELLSKSKYTPKVYDMLKFKESKIIIMDYVRGKNGQSILDKNDIEVSKKIYKLLGRCLATEVHTLKYKHSNKNLPLIKNDTGKFDKLSFIPNNLIEEVKKYIFDEEMEDYVLIHGDFGPHNSIIKDESIFIIDW